MFSLSPLRARKSDNYRYRDSWKSDNFKRDTKKKQSTDTKRMQRGLRVLTLQEAIKKMSNIIIAILEKMNDWMAP